MAKTVSLTDDFDGSSGAVERKYSIGGLDYSIDLSDPNWTRFLALIEPYRSVSRVERKGAFKLTSEDRVKIRAWAQSHGFTIKSRGRYPHAAIQAYFDSIAGDADSS